VLIFKQDLNDPIKIHELNSCGTVKKRSEEVSQWSHMTNDGLITAGDCIIRDINRKDYRKFPYNFRAADMVIIIVD
jgi:hypothetical protein